MGNVSRYRYGNEETEQFAVASATVIEAGDMVAWDASNNVCYPASAQTWDTNLATTQGNFADLFLGIALDASPNGSTAKISVALIGVFEMAQASATLDFGAAVSPAQNGTEEELLDQTVVASTPRIGKAACDYASAATSVRIRIRSHWIPTEAAAS